MTVPLSLRYGQRDDARPHYQQVQSWLKRWGVVYQHDVMWRAYNALRDESFRFKLDFLIYPAQGRKPNHYLVLDVYATATPRSEARYTLLRTLFPGEVIALNMTRPTEALQCQILDAL